MLYLLQRKFPNLWYLPPCTCKCMLLKFMTLNFDCLTENCQGSQNHPPEFTLYSIHLYPVHVLNTL